jgi:hypothetical protein
MPSVPRELAEHSLDVSKTAKPVKQKLRHFAKDRNEVIRVEFLKLLAAGFICECKNPVWLANLVHPRKPANGECVSTTPTSTVTALKTPSLFRALTRSSTPPRGAPFLLPRLLLGLPPDSLEGL